MRLTGDGSPYLGNPNLNRNWHEFIGSKARNPWIVIQSEAKNLDFSL